MIEVADEGAVRVVRLDRPERRNAITPEGLDALAEAVEATETPVVYLHGAGSAFCAGADRSAVADLARGGDAETFVRRGQRAADAIEGSDAAVVAGIDGPARGGGVELALACDVRIATPEATFGEPGVTFGLFGAWGGTVRLPETVGAGEALDFSLSGRTIDAEEALRMGLVTRIVDAPKRVAEEIAENDPLALSLVKERLRDRSAEGAQKSGEVAAFESLIEAHESELRRFDER